MLTTPQPDPVTDILEWAQRLQPWKQECVRRLARHGELAPDNRVDLLAMLKGSVNIASASATTPPALSRADICAPPAGLSVRLRAIENISNVNRLGHKGIEFEPEGLTVIYGRNGSGKSGFVRILRGACRTRIDDRRKLLVLGDVYGGGGASPKASIVISTPTGNASVRWSPNGEPAQLLASVAVFDHEAADLYVDQGNQIRFLPFVLALPHKLNAICVEFRDELEKEAREIDRLISATSVVFDALAQSAAQRFYSALSGDTTDNQIDKAALLTQEDEQWLTTLDRTLATAATAAVDLEALAAWLDGMSLSALGIGAALSDAKLDDLVKLRSTAVGRGRLPASTPPASLRVSRLPVSGPKHGGCCGRPQQSTP